MTVLTAHKLQAITAKLLAKRRRIRYGLRGELHTIIDDMSPRPWHGHSGYETRKTLAGIRVRNELEYTALPSGAPSIRLITLQASGDGAEVNALWQVKEIALDRHRVGIKANIWPMLCNL